MIWFVRFATSLQEPVVDARYYDRGLNYQDRLAALDRGKASGLGVKTDLPHIRIFPPGKRVIKFTVKANVPLTSVALQVVTERPATVVGRITLDLSEAQGKRISPNEIEFSPELDFSQTGSFDVYAEATVNKDAAAYVRERVRIR